MTRPVMHSIKPFSRVSLPVLLKACAHLARLSDARLTPNAFERARCITRAARYVGYINPWVDVYLLEVLEAFYAGSPTPERVLSRPMAYRLKRRRALSWLRGAHTVKALRKGH